MRAAMLVMAAAAILTACAAIPEGKRVETPAAVTPASAHPATICRRTTVKIDGQFEVVMICRPVDKVPADVYDKAPKSKI